MRTILSVMLSVIYPLYSYIKLLIDAVVHSEQGQVIQCDSKPGSVERSIDLEKEDIPQQQQIGPIFKHRLFFFFLK
jgi:hypothetical protein